MRRPGEHPLGLLIAGGLFVWGAWHTRGWVETDWVLTPLLLALLAAICALRLCTITLWAIPQYFIRRRALKSTGRAGTAQWATQRDIRRAGLLKKKGFFAGLHDKQPVFVEIESAGLVLSPAGGGKTVSFVVPALCHNPVSMIVPDLKGTLACMTAQLRRKKHKHKIITVNPGHLYENILGPGARYNPLQILIDAWSNPALHSQLFADAGSMARQLCPEPPHAGESQYWRNGARKFIVFAFVHLVTTQASPTLADALGLLSDTQALIAALKRAEASAVLSGDLARLARDMLAKIENGDPKQIESFREGAVQALEIFSASGSLAECTSACNFRFSDLKTQKLTIYLIADPTRIAFYAPWLGLLSWCALTELIRCQGGKPVCFLCDEITNFRIEGLPSLLTLAREFKIILWLIVQELEQWAHVYGRESLETLLSQTEAKIIMGTRSHKTCQLVSDMLGEESIKTLNHNLGASFFDPISTSVQEGPRRLMTADEVRRTDRTILFMRGYRPVQLEPVGYHEVRPWSRQVAVNPLFGKRFKGRAKLRI